MPPSETVTIRVAGHDVLMTVEPGEESRLRESAERVTRLVDHLHARADALTTPAKLNAMAALQMSYDLSVAKEMLAEAEALREELRRQKETVARLEALLAQVDSALAL
jgi:cell division protein ZapA (FtsZ GTPase activity inhibitor)